MFRILFVSLSLFLVSDSDCKRFHEGTFVFHDFGKEFKIVRKGNKQMEYVNGDEQIYSYNILWKTDCEYKIFDGKTIKGKVDISKSDLDTLTCHIVDIDKLTFKVKCKLPGEVITTPKITKLE